MPELALHDDIILLLKDAGGSLKIAEIVEKLNERRETDVPQSQVRARLHSYGKFFIVRGVNVTLRENRAVEEALDKLVDAPEAKQVPGTKAPAGTAADPRTSKFLADNGFIQLGDFKRFFDTGFPEESALSKCGVYAVTVGKNFEPSFIPPEKAQEAGNLIRPWTLEKLKEKWVEDAEVIYLGVAGVKAPRTLRARIRDLIRHGQGRTNENGPHMGGELMWQLENHLWFQLWVLPLGNPPAPREKEQELITQFEKATGKLPFANRAR